MNHSVSRVAFDRLVRADATPCVSMYLPTGQPQPDEHFAHVTLKELIGEAKHQLVDHEREQADSLLAGPVAALAKPLTTNGAAAIAFFAAPGYSTQLSLNCHVDALAVVADRFEVSPLLPALADDIGGFVLTVGADNVRLYRITGASLEECHIPGFEHSIDEALWFDRVERHAGAHSGQASSGGGRRVITHGSGAQPEDRKERLERFYHYVDKTVLDFIGARRAQPLFLVGTAPEVARFRHVTRHARAVPLPGGSPARLSNGELAARALTAARDTALAVDDVLQRIVALNGTGLASTDLAAIAQAAAEGRVDTLLVGDPTPVWGRRGADGAANMPADSVSGQSVDLVNEAVSDAWRKGASVGCAPAGVIPDGAAMAAIFRY
jgi:hypothetical protein